MRSWVLRLGDARLTRPLAHDRHWAGLIDHTPQIGATKLFVVGGVPLDRVPFGVRPLQRSDLHLVALVRMADANRGCVAAELETAVGRTGVPRQIVADGAADLPKGIDRSRERHPQTASGPDAAHHAAKLLKFYRETDPRWSAVTRRTNETAAAIRPTRSAHLPAPRLRNKARYTSAGKFVRFGRIVLRKLGEAEPAAEVVRRYGWVSEYAGALSAWWEQPEAVQATRRHVRVGGLFARGGAVLAEAWERAGVSRDPVSMALRNRLRAYVGRGRGLPAGERLVGSTGVLESALGVRKRLSRDQSESGLTVLSVGLGVLLGEVAAAEVRADAEREPEKVVQNWASRTFGMTVQWLRRQFLRPAPASKEPVPKPG